MQTAVCVRLDKLPVVRGNFVLKMLQFQKMALRSEFPCGEGTVITDLINAL
jgi:hypothetical protein